VPVLVRGELLVRGDTDGLYRAALDAPDGGTADRDETIG
jgi:hypothetical protein